MSTPSLRALRAFAEVARAGSLAEAAPGWHAAWAARSMRSTWPWPKRITAAATCASPL